MLNDPPPCEVDAAPLHPLLFRDPVAAMRLEHAVHYAQVTIHENLAQRGCIALPISVDFEVSSSTKRQRNEADWLILALE